MPRFQLAAAIAALTVLLSACDGHDGDGVQTNDTTPPSKLTMDAHVPLANGSGSILTVNTTSGDQSISLTNLPEITFIASARDDESAISDLRIEGETTVTCIGTDVGRKEQASWRKTAQIGSQPNFSPIVMLNLALGRQGVNDVPGRDYIASCHADERLMSVSGEFSAAATNGVHMSLRTDKVRFEWTRP